MELLEAKRILERHLENKCNVTFDFEEKKVVVSSEKKYYEGSPDPKISFKNFIGNRIFTFANAYTSDWSSVKEKDGNLEVSFRIYE